MLCEEEPEFYNSRHYCYLNYLHTYFLLAHYFENMYEHEDYE